MYRRTFLLTMLTAAALAMSAARAHALELTVSAAASVTNAFQEIGRTFEQANAGSKVLFNFGSSGSLLQQISRGAPVDVFVTADLETMDRAQQQNLIVNETRANFVANRLVLVAPADSRAALNSVADLAGPDVQRIGIGIPESVPAGRYAKQALENAGLWARLKDKYIFGQNVRQVLDYVARGEVDAGAVYITDAISMKDKIKVVSEMQTGAPILYPIAVVKGGGNERAARRFVAYVRSEAGQKILAKYGFGAP